MSISFPEDNLINFPDAIDEIRVFLDLTAEELPYAEQYETLMKSGNQLGATQLLANRPNLNNMLVMAKDFNKMYQMIRAVERFVKYEFEENVMGVRMWKGEWNQFTTYPMFSFVVYNNLWYATYVQGTPRGTLPTNTNYWYPCTLKGETGVGMGLTPKGYWKTSVNYVLNNMVAHNNIWWQCNTANTNSEPNLVNPNWTKQLELTSDANLISDEQTGSHYTIVVKMVFHI